MSATPDQIEAMAQAITSPRGVVEYLESVLGEVERRLDRAVAELSPDELEALGRSAYSSAGAARAQADDMAQALHALAQAARVHRADLLRRRSKRELKGKGRR